jgi:hypothetical protein
MPAGCHELYYSLGGLLQTSPDSPGYEWYRLKHSENRKSHFYGQSLAEQEPRPCASRGSEVCRAASQSLGGFHNSKGEQ